MNVEFGVVTGESGQLFALPIVVMSRVGVRRAGYTRWLWQSGSVSNGRVLALPNSS